MRISRTNALRYFVDRGIEDWHRENRSAKAKPDAADIMDEMMHRMVDKAIDPQRGREMKEVEEWWSRVLTMKSSNYKYPAEINSLDVIAQGIEDGRFSYDSVTDILTIVSNGKRFKVTDDGLVSTT